MVFQQNNGAPILGLLVRDQSEHGAGLEHGRPCTDLFQAFLQGRYRRSRQSGQQWLVHWLEIDRILR